MPSSIGSSVPTSGGRRHEREWRKHEFREVLGTVWLVIGLGTIGVGGCGAARAFGAHVIGARRTPRGDEPVDELVAPEQLQEALSRADVVVLAVPATQDTVGMVDAQFLAHMRPGSVLVNVARGSLVDEGALLVALDRGVPEAALLDVTATEPLPPESPLWTHPRVVLTPHTSALGEGRHARAEASSSPTLPATSSTIRSSTSSPRWTSSADVLLERMMQNAVPTAAMKARMSWGRSSP